MGEKQEITLEDVYNSSGEAPTSKASLPLESNNMGKFAVTIKCIKQGVFATQQDLKRVYKEMLIKFGGKSQSMVYEQDSLGRWHLHATIVAKKTLRYTSFKKKYFHIFIRRLYKLSDERRWEDYIHLDQEIQMKSFLHEISKGDYMFQAEQSVAETHAQSKIV